MNSLVHSASLHTQPGKSKTVADILTAAADLIEPEGRWTQRVISRGADGEMAEVMADYATCWCVIGAIEKAASGRGEAAIWAFRRQIGMCPAFWNDAPHRAQAEVVAALRAAAEKARAAAAEGGQ